MLEKLFDMGILGTGGSGKGKLSDIEHKVTVSAFCRRRLGVLMTKLRMAQNLEHAAGLIEQQHVRVGTELVTDPAFLVTRYVGGHIYFEAELTWGKESRGLRHMDR